MAVSSRHLPFDLITLADDLRSFVRRMLHLAWKVKRCEEFLENDWAYVQRRKLYSAMVELADDFREQRRKDPAAKAVVAWADTLVPSPYRSARTPWPEHEGLSPAFIPVVRQYEEGMLAAARHEADVLPRRPPCESGSASLDNYLCKRDAFDECLRKQDGFDTKMISIVAEARQLRPVTRADLRFMDRIANFSLRDTYRIARLQARRTAHLRDLACEARQLSFDDRG